MKQKINRNNLPKVSVVIPMRNSSSTILETLEGLRKQDYPIEEIIIMDNRSTDNAVSLVDNYKKRYPKMCIKVFINEVNIMIARSQDRGVEKTSSPYIVFTHSDCRFPSPKEIRKLIKPIIDDPMVIATYGGTVNPISVWEKYSFWEKCLLSRDAGRVQAPGLLGKVDCIQKKVFLTVGGHDTKGFDNYGCEDADLHLRLAQKGKIIKTDALAEHLHYTYSNFSLGNLFWKTKFIGEGYGRFLRINGLKYGVSPIGYMLIKPVLAIGILLPGVNLFFLPVVLTFPLFYYSKVFTSRSTLTDPRIFLLPIVGVLLVYYQTFWTIHTYLRKLNK